MTFTNHTPLNFRDAPCLARAARDVDPYPGFGDDRYEVLAGRRVHLIHHYSRTCPVSNEVCSLCAYLVGTATREQMLAWLLHHKPTWWTNALLIELGHDGIAA